jgi:hypothetical protein
MHPMGPTLTNPFSPGCGLPAPIWWNFYIGVLSTPEFRYSHIYISQIRKCLFILEVSKKVCTHT